MTLHALGICRGEGNKKSDWRKDLNSTEARKTHDIQMHVPMHPVIFFPFGHVSRPEKMNKSVNKKVALHR